MRKRATLPSREGLGSASFALSPLRASSLVFSISFLFPLLNMPRSCVLKYSDKALPVIRRPLRGQWRVTTLFRKLLSVTHHPLSPPQQGGGQGGNRGGRRMTGSALSKYLKVQAAQNVAFGVSGAAQAPLGGSAEGGGRRDSPPIRGRPMTGNALSDTFSTQLRGTFHDEKKK